MVDDKPRSLGENEQRVLCDLAGMVMTQIELQNTIGRIDATSGYPNQHQMFEDIEGLARRLPDENRVGLLLDLAAPHQVGHGLRVLGAAYTEELIRSSAEVVRQTLGNSVYLYQVGTTRIAAILDEAGGRPWMEVAKDLDALLRRPIACNGIPVIPHPAIGVYPFRSDRAQPRDILRRLFSAADDARASGQPIAVYSEARDLAHTRSFRLLSDIRHALDAADELRACQ